MTATENITFWLGAAQLVVGVLAVALVFLGYVEFVKVKALRDELEGFRKDLDQRFYAAQKAQQRLVASYGVKDVAQKIALIESAIAADPATFNGWNALGYAHWENNDLDAALAAFLRATTEHPEAIEGWFDLARLWVARGRNDQAVSALHGAARHHPETWEEARKDAVLKALELPH